MSTVPTSLTWSTRSPVASFATPPPARERRAVEAAQVVCVPLNSAVLARQAYSRTTSARFGRRAIYQPFPAIPTAADDTLARWARRRPAPTAPDPLDAR